MLKQEKADIIAEMNAVKLAWRVYVEDRALNQIDWKLSDALLDRYNSLLKMLN